MVSPEDLQLVGYLIDEGDEFDPEIADNGAVSYPKVEEILGKNNDDPVDVLEGFTARGVLANEFVSKVYVCPECSAEGMQYTTVCPTCEAAHAVEMTVFEHDCGYIGPKEEFKSGEYRCPNCEIALQSEDLDEKEHYVCKECGEVFATPDDRLWCRECLYMFPSRETIERVLYRYSLTPNGERWYDRHRSARRAVAEALQERRFETEIDATVTQGAEVQSVHVLAEDDLMGEQRVVTIHETPDTKSVDEFCAFAESIGADPIIVTTSGTVEENVAARAEDSELKLLTFTEDGTLEAEYETTESAAAHRQGLFQRLTGAVNVPSRK